MKIDGLPVVDAAKPVTIHITKTDIAKGDTKDPAACAAARACVRELGASAARVHLGRTYVKLDGKWMRLGTSKALRSEIIAFDRGGSFEPGEYLLTPLKPSSRVTGKRQGGAKVRMTGKKRAKYHTITGVRAHGANR